MSNAAWCDLISKGDILKPHDIYPTLNVNVKSKSLLLIDNTTSKEPDLKIFYKIFCETQTARNEFLKPVLILTAHVIGLALASKTKNPQVGHSAANILKFFSG